MGCGASNAVIPHGIDSQSSLIQQNNELKQEIEKYKFLAKQKQIELEKLQEESAKNEKHLEANENNEIKSVKHPTNIQKVKFNEHLKKMEERDKKLIDQLKDGRMFEDDNFEYFTQLVEENSNDNNPIKWLRPFEIVANPIIGLDYINPNEVKQGNLGDCWFLAALSSVAKYPHLYAKVIPENIALNGNNYKGYFKASFWQYGEWINIYIDDKLPTKRGDLIYGSCKTNNNFWVPLLEKSYAKLMGGYKEMIGGISERALVDLTGLMFISFKPNLLNTLPERFLIEDELNKKNELIGCCAIRLKKENAKSDEDYDGHAFSILCINKVNIKSKAKLERIYTIRNPHGYAKEASRWSSNHPIWVEIDEESKRKCLYDENDLLTWMNNDAIKTYFSSVTLGCYVPTLNNRNNGKLFEFSEKWTQKDIDLNMINFLDKKHYLLNVKSTSKSKNDKAFVLCNLLQENINQELMGISVTLIPIRSKKQISNIGSINYKDLPDKFTNKISRQVDSYYFLPVGYYVLIPMIYDLKSANSLNYILRVFSNEEINVEEIFFNLETMKFSSSNDEKLINIILRKCNFCEKLIEGQYTHSDNFVYHRECYDSLVVCDNCQKKIDGSYYTMQNNLKFCVNCYQYNQERINSAKLK